MVEYTQKEFLDIFKRLQINNKKKLSDKYAGHFATNEIEDETGVFLAMFIWEGREIDAKDWVDKLTNTLEEYMPSSRILYDRITARIGNVEHKNFYYTFLNNMRHIFFEVSSNDVPVYIEDKLQDVSIIASWRLEIGK